MQVATTSLVYLCCVLITFIAGHVTEACQCYLKPFGEPGSQASCSEGQVAFNGKSERCTCRRGGMTDCFRIRRDFTSMPWKERMRFINALIKVSTQDPYKRSYDQLIATHTNNFKNGIHKADQFLPWHRLYLLEIENLLRRVDPVVTLPYWDWSLFSGLPWKRGFNDVFSSAPWGFGGNGGRGQCVVNGPFRSNRWKTTPSNRHGCLKRSFNGNPPDVVAVHELNRVPGNDFTKFEMVLRDTLHNNMHCRIGGRGGTMCSTSSANAPEFLLHHGFTDKLWADWQKIGDVNGDRKQRDSFFESKGYRMTAKKYSPRDLLDLSRQPGGVKVMYEHPSHDHYQRVHGYLKTLSLKELKDIPRKRFTESGTLEFKIFMVTSRSEQLSTMAQQSSLEPKRSLSNGDLRTTADRTLGMRIKDIEAAAKRKRGLKLAKKESRADHATV
ncbi:hemocyanin, beta-C chain unit D-like [Nematostella vectensis]|uniref:hemocyanin, beta-C chain unit D-like n=1 Tax=Nematostella vectensis TaxID=45351 RepID=UPI002077800C|nr:hemocyanin, beta-C chain unit D-like [Nematostella vectensis]